jgi:hypothetical protein
MPVSMGFVGERCRTVYFISRCRTSAHITYQRTRKEFKLTCPSPCCAVVSLSRYAEGIFDIPNRAGKRLCKYHRVPPDCSAQGGQVKRAGTLPPDHSGVGPFLPSCFDIAAFNLSLAVPLYNSLYFSVCRTAQSSGKPFK